VSSKSSLSEKTHEATKEKATREERREEEKERRRREEECCLRRANRCKQAASDASSRFRQEDVLSFCREEVNNSLNRLKN
jgi:hypothetical protein